MYPCKTPCGDIDCLNSCINFKGNKTMNQVKFTTTLYFDVPEGVAPSEQIEYLNNLLHRHTELLLLKVQDINTEGKREFINE